MSKKDYQAIARALHQVRPDYAKPQWETWDKCVKAVAGVFSARNPRFNWSLFEEACATGKCRGMK